MFTGCVMDAWQRDVHLAGQRVLEAAGFEVLLTGSLAPCCGALHAHAGFTDDTRSFAERMIERLEPDVPIVVDSAGCGAAMKDYGHLLGTDRAEQFSARVFDIQEWLAMHIDRLPTAEPLDLRVAVQDPCHLRHVQRVHLATRTVLAPYVRELVELDDDGLCCGAGGAYCDLPAGARRSDPHPQARLDRPRRARRRRQRQPRLLDAPGRQGRPDHPPDAAGRPRPPPVLPIRPDRPPSRHHPVLTHRLDSRLRRAPGPHSAQTWTTGLVRRMSQGSG